MRYSQPRSELRPSKRSSPRQARRSVSWSASSASWSDPSIRYRCASSSRRCGSTRAGKSASALTRPASTTPADPPPRRTGSAAASSRPSPSHSTPATAPISSTGLKTWPYVDASAWPSGEAMNAGSAWALAVLRWDTRGAATASGSGMPSSRRLTSICSTVVMIVAPPGDPSARNGSPSRSTIVGAIEERGRLPPLGAVRRVGVVEVEVRQLVVEQEPVAGTTIALPPICSIVNV